MRKVVLLGLLLLVIISSGCGSETTYEQPKEIVIEEEPVITSAPRTQTPQPTTLSATAPATTPSPPMTTAPPTTAPQTTTAPPITPITTNPKFKVLTLDDVGNDYLVTSSEYNNLEMIVDEGAPMDTYNSLKESGWIESYTVEFENDSKSVALIENTVSRYEPTIKLENRWEFIETSCKEMTECEIMMGKSFGDKSLYRRFQLQRSILGTDIYLDMYALDFSVNNFKIFISVAGFSRQVGVSDIYPYATILEKRILSSEEIIPPEISSPTTVPEE